MSQTEILYNKPKITNPRQDLLFFFDAQNNSVTQKTVLQKNISAPEKSKGIQRTNKIKDAASIQKQLNNLGFTVSSTGPGSPGKETSYFGPATRAALIAFQKSQGLTPDGILGPKTHQALLQKHSQKTIAAQTEKPKQRVVKNTNEGTFPKSWIVNTIFSKAKN